MKSVLNENIFVTLHEGQVNHILKSLAMLLGLKSLAFFIFLKAKLFNLYGKKLGHVIFFGRQGGFCSFSVQT
jgi:hypothetical protein